MVIPSGWKVCDRCGVRYGNYATARHACLEKDVHEHEVAGHLSEGEWVSGPLNGHGFWWRPFVEWLGTPGGAFAVYLAHH